jgi:hypothetical protein
MSHYLRGRYAATIRVARRALVASRHPLPEIFMHRFYVFFLRRRACLSRFMLLWINARATNSNQMAA